MNKSTITIGIDLGTTNSEIAIKNKEGNIEVVKNINNDEYTPSIFGVMKSKSKMVGRKAYDKLYKAPTLNDTKNIRAEVKRLMGTDEKIAFPYLEKELTPEEVSAEILMSLKGDVLRKYPDYNTVATVITVPAYFDTLQAEATIRAGKLAGFEHVVLLQEPIAAAMTYGFKNEKNQNWIVYDLGGGTFDVALISSQDGVLTVLSHNGDNYLGGKDIDNAIIENIIEPEVRKKFNLPDFQKSNTEYSHIYSKIKYAAEMAKIDLTQLETTNIEIDNVGNDNDGEEIYLSTEFKRTDFNRIVKPYIDKTITLTDKTIKDAGIKKSAINKIVLVGGTTRIPYIKESLEKNFGIDADNSVDPLTVVSKGACIYGGSQKIPEKILNKDKKQTKGILAIKLNYDSLSSEIEESISGWIPDLVEDSNDYYIQIQSDSGHFSSEKHKIKEGKFFEEVVLEKYKDNVFWIYLFDKNGDTLKIDPDSFTISHGLTISGAPIPRSIGLAVAKKDFDNRFGYTEVMDNIFEKGSSLPLKSSSKTYKTRKAIKRGEDIGLPIKIYEGESSDPENNTFICDLKINGKDLPVDLPEKSEVEIVLEVDESREVKVSVYIPLIDKWLNARGSILAEKVEVEKIENELEACKERYNKVESSCNQEEKSKVDSLFGSINKSINNARVDNDDKQKADKEIKDLRVELEKLEKDKAMPQLENEFKQKIEDTKKLIGELGQNETKEENLTQLQTLENEGGEAINNKDKDLLVRVNEQISELVARVMMSNPATWVYYFQELEKDELKFADIPSAKIYFEKGKMAMQTGNIDELKYCVRSLLALLPKEDQNTIKQGISGITE